MFIAVLVTEGCTDSLLPEADGTGKTVLDEGELSEVKLNLSVNPFTVDMRAGTRASDPSNTPEAATEEENKIYDIWVFQYDASTEKLLIKPRYYTITDQTMLSNLPVQLKTDVGGESVIYVVANTDDSDWANDGTDASWQKFSTLTQLQEAALPEPFPVQVTKNESTEENRVSIPMGGSKRAAVTAGSEIEVPVTRMYAKLKVRVNIGDGLKDDLTVESINITEIPWYCRIETLVGQTDADGEPVAVDFPDKTQFISRAFATSNHDEDEEGWVVIYVPETIRGETDKEHKVEEQPDNALTINVTTRYEGSVLVYTVYPGGNTTDNFNILRNCVYRVTVNINTIVDSQHQPSANCFIVEPDGFLAFEPYYRVETGGGYDFSNYLNPDVEDLTIKKLEIIWQTKDCIGDNTEGKLVYLEDGDLDLHQRIYVHTNKKGNALIAARNSKNEIIWSWHIWVTDNEPDNLGKAVVYTTYDWDENGIYHNRRIPGYAVMSCNLGALADTPTGSGIGIETYGMLYQWGRKDPFPPVLKEQYAPSYYNNEETGAHYGNDNRTEVNKTAQTVPEDYLFHSVIGSSLTGAVRYSIANPTIFICGTNEALQDYDYVNNINNYFNKGDWCPVGESDDKLWGGLPPQESSKSLAVTNSIHMYDNYGDEKSIFDPCPRGWRVAPAELWLEFSSTGYNPSSVDEINYDQEHSTNYGMAMYMQAWRSGPTSYFPTQGTRIGSGGGIRVAYCGNYHNATTDSENRVNILHIHNDYRLFHIFESSYLMYYVKSTAGPIRCVRDSK